MPKRTTEKPKAPRLPAKRRRPTADRPRGEALPLNFINLLRGRVEGFTALPADEQQNLAYLVWNESAWHRQHARLEGHMTIPYQELERRFGRGRFKAVNAAVQMFEVTRQWSAVGGWTRGFKLTPTVAAIKGDYLRSTNVRLSHLIQSDGKRMRTLPESIASKDMEGRTQTFWRNANVVKRIKVDVEGLRLMHVRLMRLHDDLQAGRGSGDLFIPGGDPKETGYYCEVLSQLLRLTHTRVAGRGYIGIRYFVGKTGRLYARGVSLQNAPKLVRQVALHGFWDYDIENCHYAIFKQMAAKCGYAAEAIVAYLANKRATRQGIADRVRISGNQVKECLLAIMYGAPQSSRDEDAIPGILGGQESARRLYADPVFARLLHDIRIGRQIILARHPSGPKAITNAVGLRIAVTEPPRFRLAHLIQGVEAQALRAAQAEYPEDIVLLMHDGWVSRKRLDRDRLVAVMREATGYEFEVSEERITVPADLDLTNLKN